MPLRTLPYPFAINLRNHRRIRPAYARGLELDITVIVYAMKNAQFFSLESIPHGCGDVSLSAERSHLTDEMWRVYCVFIQYFQG